MTNAPIWCRHIPLKFDMQSQCNVMWTAVAPVVPYILRMVQFRWNTPRCSSLQWKLWQLVWNRKWKSSFFVISPVAGTLSVFFQYWELGKQGSPSQITLFGNNIGIPNTKISEYLIDRLEALENAFVCTLRYLFALHCWTPVVTATTP
jgi:hypothetical protein